MKVILLKSVQKIGKKDDIVEVATGYAEHALFPKKIAIAATPTALSILKRNKENSETKKEIRHTLLDNAIKTLNQSNILIRLKANEKGNLFSKIHETDIAQFLMKEYRIAIDPRLMILPDGPIKKLGCYTVRVATQGYTALFEVNLVRE